MALLPRIPPKFKNRPTPPTPPTFPSVRVVKDNNFLTKNEIVMKPQLVALHNLKASVESVLTMIIDNLNKSESNEFIWDYSYTPAKVADLALNMAVEAGLILLQVSDYKVKIFYQKD